MVCEYGNVVSVNVTANGDTSVRFCTNFAKKKPHGV